MVKIEVTDNTSVHVNKINDEFYAMTDSAKLNKIDIKSLDTIGHVNLGENFKIMGNTSQVHTSKEKTVYSMGTSVSASGATYNIIEFPNSGKGFENAKIVAKMHASSRLHPSSIHSFGITENFFVIIESPVKISLGTALKSGMVPMAFSEFTKWQDEENSKIHLLSRSTGKLYQSFESDPFFFFHVGNCFEKENHVIMDLVCYKDNSFSEYLYFESLAKNNPERVVKCHPNVMRFVMPLNHSKEKNFNFVKLKNSSAAAHLVNDKIHCIPELICDFGSVVPKINYKYSGVEHKFLYSHGLDGGIIKINVERKEKVHWVEDDIIVFDGCFIESPDSQEEDDGIILTGFSKPSIQNYVGLLILDAKNLKEIARCEFGNLPTVIPKPLFSTYFAE